MFIWDKLGRVYNPHDFENRSDWMYEFSQAPCTLIFDDFVRVYFGSRPKRDANGQFVTYSSYVDLNRRNLFKIERFAKKPVLKLGNLGCFDEFGTYPLSVINKGNEIWGYYAGWTRCESVPFNVGIGLGISKDKGETFRKIGEGPILPYSLHEPFVLSGPKIRKFGDTYYLFYIAGRNWLLVSGKPEISHKIRMAVSSDGLNWTKVNKDLIPDGWGENESQASPDIFYANGKYHMFFCGWLPSNFRITRKRLIGYAFSTDLMNWVRDDSKVGITLSGNGWDSEMVAYPHVFELDGETYMLYIGNEVGRYGFGLAKLNGKL
ncbi:MAG: hypothetical protein RIB47_11565 [Cyclobacteriaceae bacterium]